MRFQDYSAPRIIEVKSASDGLLMAYIDGSCLENKHVNAQTPASWSVVIVTGDNELGKGTGTIMTEFFGRVQTNPDADDFIGAEVGSNNTGELTAMAEALRWLLKHNEEREVLVRTDSTYAGNIASGHWRARANLKLASHVQALWNEVSSICQLKWKHVRAHKGHRWNERADHLAFRVLNEQEPIPFSFWKPGQR